MKSGMELKIRFPFTRSVTLVLNHVRTFSVTIKRTNFDSWLSLQSARISQAIELKRLPRRSNRRRQLLAITYCVCSEPGQIYNWISMAEKNELLSPMRSTMFELNYLRFWSTMIELNLLLGATRNQRSMKSMLARLSFMVLERKYNSVERWRLSRIGTWNWIECHLSRAFMVKCQQKYWFQCFTHCNSSLWRKPIEEQASERCRRRNWKRTRKIVTLDSHINSRGEMPNALRYRCRHTRDRVEINRHSHGCSENKFKLKVKLRRHRRRQLNT